MRRHYTVVLGALCALTVVHVMFAPRLLREGDRSNADSTPQDTSAAPAYSMTTIAGGMVIVDHIQGLLWEAKTSDGGMRDWSEVRDWVQASDYCDALNTQGGGYAGFSDWRMPTVHELYGIVDCDAFAPAVFREFHDPNAGSYCRPAMYWSSTVPAADLGRAYYVDFFAGTIHMEIKYIKMYVRAVRTIGLSEKLDANDAG